MNTYSDAVAKIAEDYLDRIKTALRLVPAQAGDDFVREIESHIYESYQRELGDDDVRRMFGVLRKIGEPAEVVANQLPGAFVRSGARRNLPMHIIGGVLIALFGIPLGFGGVAVLIGILAGIAGVVAAYYATAAVLLLTGTGILSLGLLRVYRPETWERLLAMGLIQDDHLRRFLEQLTASEQAFVIIATAIPFAAAAVGMFWLGRHLIRGLRFLFNLGFDWFRRAVRLGQQKLHGPGQQWATSSQDWFASRRDQEQAL